jgi:protein phosphatase
VTRTTDIQLPDPCLVVLVGAAGSGKTTFAVRHFAPDEILSSDAYRGRLAGDPADQRATGAAFAALHKDLGRRLAEHRLTVVDATSVTAPARRALLRAAAAAGLPAVAVVLDLPSDLVLARNAARRGRVVPEAAVRRHLRDLAAARQDPDLAAEGFAAVVRLRTPAAVDAVRVTRLPGSGTRSGARG